MSDDSTPIPYTLWDYVVYNMESSVAEAALSTAMQGIGLVACAVELSMADTSRP